MTVLEMIQSSAEKAGRVFERGQASGDWTPSRPRLVGIAILTAGIGSLAWARHKLTPDRGEPQNGSVARERSGDDMDAKQSEGLPPGSYTRENLPPPGPEVQAILDRVYATAEKLRAARMHSGSGKVNGPSGQFLVSDKGKRRIEPGDKGKRLVGRS